MHHVSDKADLGALLGADVAVIYKHSPTCGWSALAFGEVRRFAESHPHVPVYVVDVVGQRALSQRLAEALAVGHESPQAIVVQNGRPRWNGSLVEVTAEALARETACS